MPVSWTTARVNTVPPNFKSDSTLLKKVGQGHADAVATLYRTYVDSVFRFVYRRVEDRYEDAEEITQDTFLSALNLASTYQGDSSVLTGLAGIEKQKTPFSSRKQTRHKRVPLDSLISLEIGPAGRQAQEQ